MMESIIVYSHYEYEDSPLFILRAGMPCNRAEFSNAAAILAALDEWYGNTEQETTEWALEFEIWARSLLLDGGLMHCVNQSDIDRDWSCKDACDHTPGIRKADGKGDEMV